MINEKKYNEKSTGFANDFLCEAQKSLLSLGLIFLLIKSEYWTHELSYSFQFLNTLVTTIAYISVGMVKNHRRKSNICKHLKKYLLAGSMKTVVDFKVALKVNLPLIIYKVWGNPVPLGQFSASLKCHSFNINCQLFNHFGNFLLCLGHSFINTLSGSKWHPMRIWLGRKENLRSKTVDINYVLLFGCHYLIESK